VIYFNTNILYNFRSKNQNNKQVSDHQGYVVDLFLDI